MQQILNFMVLEFNGETDDIVELVYKLIKTVADSNLFSGHEKFQMVLDAVTQGSDVFTRQRYSEIIQFVFDKRWNTRFKRFKRRFKCG